VTRSVGVHRGGDAVAVRLVDRARYFIVGVDYGRSISSGIVLERRSGVERID